MPKYPKEDKELREAVKVAVDSGMCVVDPETERRIYKSGNEYVVPNGAWEGRDAYSYEFKIIVELFHLPDMTDKEAEECKRRPGRPEMVYMQEQDDGRYLATKVVDIRDTLLVIGKYKSPDRKMEIYEFTKMPTEFDGSEEGIETLIWRADGLSEAESLKEKLKAFPDIKVEIKKA